MVDYKTPVYAKDAELYWATSIGSGYDVNARKWGHAESKLMSLSLAGAFFSVMVSVPSLSGAV